jgi:hypothetical protein
VWYAANPASTITAPTRRTVPRAAPRDNLGWTVDEVTFLTAR